MYKALLVALIGLFFSTEVFAGTLFCKIYNAPTQQTALTERVADFQLPSQSQSGNSFLDCLEFYTTVRPPAVYNHNNSSCRWSNTLKLTVCTSFASSPTPPMPERCSVNPALPECDDGTPVNFCPDGTPAPGNDLAACPPNCDILNGPVDPAECDTSGNPDGYCTEMQTPIFDDCVYGPDDPRNELDEDDFCEQFPEALACNPPPFPDLDTPPPAGGTGTGTDTGTPTPPPPPVTDELPDPTKTNLTKQDHKDTNKGVESRIDNLRYDIAKLHSGLNHQTKTIANGLTGVGQQLKANGAKTDRSNDLLSGINKNLDGLNAGLKGEALTSGNFDVEGGINSALGVTGDESIADLTDEPVTLESYREEFQPFLTTGQCPQNLPVALTLFGSNFNFVFYYQPVCDLMGVIGSILNWAVWLSVPFIVFGRRRAS